MPWALELAHGLVVEEVEEEGDDDEGDDGGLSVSRREGPFVFFFLLSLLQCFNLFKNFLGDGGALGNDFHTAGNHTLDEGHLVTGGNLAGFGFFF